MDPVVGLGESDQQAVHAERLLQILDHRDRAAAADDRRRPAPFLGERDQGRLQVRAVDRQRAGARTAMRVERDAAILGDPGPHMGAERGAHRVRILAGDHAERDLGRGLPGQHGLEALSAIAAGDAVDLAGRPRPGLFQRAVALLSGGNPQPDRAEQRVVAAADPGPGLAHLCRRILHPVIEARQRDATVRIAQRRQDVDQQMQRVARRVAIQAGMQVAVGAGDDDLLADQAAQHGGDRRYAVFEHVGVADQGDVGAQLVAVGVEERAQARSAALLLAFEQHRDPHRIPPVGRPDRPQRLQEGHDLALVVRSAAGGDAAFGAGVGGGSVDQHRLERSAVPQRQRIDRLHVVMAVEQDVRSFGRRTVVRDHDRQAGCLAHAGLEAERGQVRA